MCNEYGFGIVWWCSANAFFPLHRCIVGDLLRIWCKIEWCGRMTGACSVWWPPQYSKYFAAMQVFTCVTLHNWSTYGKWNGRLYGSLARDGSANASISYGPNDLIVWLLAILSAWKRHVIILLFRTHFWKKKKKETSDFSISKYYNYSVPRKYENCPISFRAARFSSTLIWIKAFPFDIGLWRVSFDFD